MINQYDVVESLINIPEENLYIGDEGTVVEDFDDNYCKINLASTILPLFPLIFIICSYLVPY
jgi:hypothetical protein